MEYENRQTSGGGYRISTPIFPDWDTMNGFYGHAHEMIEKSFLKAKENGKKGMLLCDYYVSEYENGIISVELCLRVRFCGRITERKSLRHIWQNGFIAPKKAAKKISAEV